MSQHKYVGFTLFGRLKILQRSELVPSYVDLQSERSCL